MQDKKEIIQAEKEKKDKEMSMKEEEENMIQSEKIRFKYADEIYKG